MTETGDRQVEPMMELLLLLTLTNVLLAEHLLRGEIEAELGPDFLAGALFNDELEELSERWRLKT